MQCYDYAIKWPKVPDDGFQIHITDCGPYGDCEAYFLTFDGVIVRFDPLNGPRD